MMDKVLLGVQPIQHLRCITLMWCRKHNHFALLTQQPQHFTAVGSYSDGCLLFSNIKINTSITSPVGKLMERMTSDGESLDSLQWIRVSSKSNTIVFLTNYKGENIFTFIEGKLLYLRLYSLITWLLYVFCKLEGMKWL